MKKHIYIALASIFIGFGVIGIFLPLLPTTPFLLMAAYFYMNSSYKRLRWLLNNKHLGPYIRSYLSKEGIPLRLKIRTITLLWFTLGATIIFATEKLLIRLILVAIGIGVTIHLLIKKTKHGSI